MVSVDNKMWWKVWILTTVDFLLRGARAACSLSSLCLGMVSLWTSSSPATEWQKPVHPLFTSSVSICSEPIHDKEHLVKHPSLGSRTVGVEQAVVSHCDPAEAIRERSTPDPEALVPALHFWSIVPQSQTVFPSMSKCFLRSPPWGVPVRYSLSPVAELSPLCCCHVICTVALSSYFVVICKVYSSQKLLFSVHRAQTLKLLWFPFTHLWASSSLRNWDSWRGHCGWNNSLHCDDGHLMNVMSRTDVPGWSRLGVCSFQSQNKLGCCSCNNSSSCNA